ncbi:MAG TPA: acyl carrier protein [Oceanipulchritudo sp.]|nr:acyl carrier protein [Oceanipulchritudo sp.]
MIRPNHLQGRMLLESINTVRMNKGLQPLDTLGDDQDLRRDLGLDSLDLAELTVRLEAGSGVDVFQAGLVTTVGEVLERLEGQAE